jgi:hypothetical protein
MENPLFQSNIHPHYSEFGKKTKNPAHEGGELTSFQRVLFLVVSFLAYSSILKIEVIWFSETSGCI